LGHFLIRGEEQFVLHVEKVIPNVEIAQEDFCRYISISYKVGNNDELQETLALFDTQCPGDWTSVSFVKETWGVDFSGQPRSCVAGTLNGVAVQSFGRINLAWSSRDNRSGWLRGKLSFKPKTYRASFEVIDTEDFNIIIGQKSIARHKLLILNNRLFGLFKAHRPAIRKGESKIKTLHQGLTDLATIDTQNQVADSQARADVRRAEAERLRSQADAQSVSSSSSIRGVIDSLTDHSRRRPALLPAPRPPTANDTNASIIPPRACKFTTFTRVHNVYTSSQRMNNGNNVHTGSTIRTQGVFTNP
jgi:hypothetical protein